MKSQLNFHDKMKLLLTDFLEGKPKHKSTFIFTVRDVHVVEIYKTGLTHEMSCARKSLVTWMGKCFKDGPITLDGWTVTVWSKTNPFKYQAVRQ